MDPWHSRAGRRPALGDGSPTLSDEPVLGAIPPPPRLPSEVTAGPTSAAPAEKLVLDFEELAAANDELAELDLGWTTDMSSGIRPSADSSEAITIPCPAEERPSERPTIPCPRPAGRP